jgi:hypothetical protein
LHQFIGGNPDRRAIGVDVAMQVDQARGHEFARGVDSFQGAGSRDLGLDGLDHAPADADVALPAQRLAGIEYVAALDHEVKLVGGPHRRLGGIRKAP